MKFKVKNYTFDKTAGTVTFTDFVKIDLEAIYMISNVTFGGGGTVIFNMAGTGLTGTVGTNVLTLTYDTSSMSNTDKLVIIYDNGVESDGGHPNIITTRANYAAAQTNTAIVNVGAGFKVVVCRCSVLADKANSVDVQVRIGFGAATTPTGDGVVLSHPGIAAGSGLVEGAGWPNVLGRGADGEDLRITSEAPTDGSIDVVVSWYGIDES